MTYAKKFYISFIAAASFWTVYEVFKRGVDVAHILAVVVYYWLFPCAVVSIIYWIFCKKANSAKIK